MLPLVNGIDRQMAGQTDESQQGREHKSWITYKTPAFMDQMQYSM